MRKDRVGWLDGLFIGASNATLVIDPSTTRRIPKTARVLVSPAHGDHTGGFRYRGLKQSPPQTEISIALYTTIESRTFADSTSMITSWSTISGSRRLTRGTC